MNRSITMNFNQLSFTLILSLVLVVSYRDYAGGYPSHKVLHQEKQYDPPPFEVDSAYFYIQQQVNFGPRVPNTHAHRLCAMYLQKKLIQLGGQVQVQAFEARAFNGETLHLKNIIARFNPSHKKRILLAAHWDTRPFADKDTSNKDVPIDGANDGASGVGVLLEIARVIGHSHPPEVGVDIIFFDGEDYGEPQDHRTSLYSNNIFWCLGAQYWSNNKHEKNYTAAYGILLDMVGAAKATFYREQQSMDYAPQIVKKVWDTAHQLGYGQYFVYQDTKGYILDDHLFVNSVARIPMITIIDHDPSSDGFFPSYHHTHQDNLQLIHKKTLSAVGETLLHVIYQECVSS